MGSGRMTGKRRVRISLLLLLFVLDTASLQAIAKQGDVTGNLAEVQQLAEALGISGTPSYVIGDELVHGGQLWAGAAYRW